MNAINDYLAMGGYALYIWPTYIVFAVLLLGTFFHSRHFAKSTEARLMALKKVPTNRPRDSDAKNKGPINET